MRRALDIALDAYWRFLADDGWAIASHIALSALMAMFPFFIVLTSLAGFFFGSGALADEVAQLMLATWPDEVAGPIAREIRNVLTTTHPGVLTLGAAFAIYFASSGVESLRIGLNRAYGVAETRYWFLLRLESIGYVLVAALGLLTLGFLIVLGPLIFSTALRYAPWLEPLEGTFTIFRFGIAIVVLTVALFVAHKWLPAGRRRIIEILPGIVATLALWIVAGVAFGRYLSQYSFTYVSYYAGLASAMIALVFLYWTASIFVYGGALNAAIFRRPPPTRSVEKHRLMAYERYAREAPLSIKKLKTASAASRSSRHQLGDCGLEARLDRRPHGVAARLHDRLAAHQHRFHRALSGDEDPGIEPLIARARGEIRMIAVEHHDVGARAGGERADRPLQRLRARGQHGGEQHVVRSTRPPAAS